MIHAIIIRSKQGTKLLITVGKEQFLSATQISAQQEPIAIYSFRTESFQRGFCFSRLNILLQRI